MSLQHGLAAVTEARSLDGDRLEGAADLVDDQGRQGLALDVLGDDQQRLARLHDLLQDREQVLDGGDLAVDDQDVGVVEDGLHPLGVGHEVGRDVALVEAHALGELKLEAEGVALLDGDDAFLADLVHRLGDDLADGGVAGGDRGGRSDLLLGLDVLGELGQLVGDGGDGGLDAPLEGHRVGTGRDVAQALTDQRLGQDGRRRRAVTGHVVGLLGDLLDQLSADLLVRVLELDLLGDAHTIVGDGGRAPLLLEDDVAALRAERHLDGVGEDVHAPLETAARLLVERDNLGHSALSSWTLTIRRAASAGGAPHCVRTFEDPAGSSSVGPDSPRRPAPERSSRPKPHRPDHWHSPAASANHLFSTLPPRVQANPKDDRSTLNDAGMSDDAGYDAGHRPSN